MKSPNISQNAGSFNSTLIFSSIIYIIYNYCLAWQLIYKALLYQSWEKRYIVYMIQREELECLYIKEGKSMQEIARILSCSVHKIAYWMDGYNILRRSISDAIYRKHNPNGDPFLVHKPKTLKEKELFGLGIGLYWGEGNKANENSIRLGNTDPKLIYKFIEFLVKIYKIDRRKLKFGLQIFSDMDPAEALSFWIKKTGAKQSQFQKVIVTPARGIGTYRKKTKHGVLTVHYNNKKLRDIICGEIDNIT